MITYPIKFEGSALAPQGIATTWSTGASDFTFNCSVPKEFEGPGSECSPEDFFLMAAMNCFVATFKVYAHYSKFSFESLNVSAELIVDKNAEGKPCMKSVVLHALFKGAANHERAKSLVQKVMANGFILQSLKTEVSVETAFED